MKGAPFTKSQSDLKENKSSNASSPATDSSPLTIREEVFAKSVINTKNEPSRDKELISSTGVDSKKNKIQSKSIDDRYGHSSTSVTEILSILQDFSDLGGNRWFIFFVKAFKKFELYYSDKKTITF